MDEEPVAHGQEDDEHAELKFSPGQIVATPGALEHVPPQEMRTALDRHLRGDWGEVCRDDWRENDISLERGFRLLSVYQTAVGIRFYVITEHDHSVTTILLPDEY